MNYPVTGFSIHTGHEKEDLRISPGENVRLADKVCFPVCSERSGFPSEETLIANSRVVVEKDSGSLEVITRVLRS